LSIKDLQSGGGGLFSSDILRMKGEGDAESALFGAKKSDFSKFTARPHGQEGNGG